MKRLDAAINAVLRAAPVTAPEEITVAGSVGRALSADVRAGDTILKAGSVLRPAHVALLAGEGIERASVRKPPVAGIALVGEGGGKGGERISVMAEALCREAGAGADETKRFDAVDKRLYESAGKYDCFISFGGEHQDHITILKDCGARILFDALDVTPGGNSAAAVLDDTLVLIGSAAPEEAFVMLELLARPALRAMLRGFVTCGGWINAELRDDVEIAPEAGITRLLPARLWYRGGAPCVSLIEESGSAPGRFARAEALVIITGGAPVYDKHSIVEAIPLPFDDRFFE